MIIKPESAANPLQRPTFDPLQDTRSPLSLTYEHEKNKNPNENLLCTNKKSYPIKQQDSLHAGAAMPETLAIRFAIPLNFTSRAGTSPRTGSRSPFSD